MASILPAIVGTVTGVGLYVALDFYCLSGRRRHRAGMSGAADRGSAGGRGPRKP